MTDVKPALPETIAMRKLDEGARDQMIADSENVVDLRPVLEFRGKQQRLAEQYRKPVKPDGDGPSFA